MKNLSTVAQESIRQLSCVILCLLHETFPSFINAAALYSFRKGRYSNNCYRRRLFWLVREKLVFHRFNLENRS